MRKIFILTICTIFSLMFGLTACGEKVSNNLGGATRKNSSYDYVGNEYSYDYSAMGTDKQNSRIFNANQANTPGYWDYYGITNGSANDSMRNDLSNGYNTSGFYQNTPYDTFNTPIGTTNTANTANTTLDSATIAD